MCGVFGFVADGNGELNLSRLEKIARVTERRGPDAFGFAWIDRRGKLHCFKQTGRITDYMGILAIAEEATMLIGHCRWATHGNFTSNVNNHPHPSDGGWIVHNGTLPRFEDVINDYSLSPVSDCDSEVLGLLVEQFDGSIGERCAKAVEAAAPGERGQPLVMLGLWSRPNRLAVVRRGNPLHWAKTKAGVYLASLPDEMPGTPKPVKNDSVHVFTPKTGCKFRSIGTVRSTSRTLFG